MKFVSPLPRKATKKDGNVRKETLDQKDETPRLEELYVFMDQKDNFVRNNLVRRLTVRTWLDISSSFYATVFVGG